MVGSRTWMSGGALALWAVLAGGVADAEPRHEDVHFGPEAVPMPAVHLKPVSGEVTSRFGMRFHPIRRVRKMHKGVDFKGRRGQPVRAAGDGIVVRARWGTGYGRVVYIQHENGVETRYAHLSRYHVRVGQRVKAGQKIGRVGSSGGATGPHLHFEVRVDGRAVDPARYHRGLVTSVLAAR